MKQSFSIAQARAALPRLVHEAERGEPIELTRRGRPVAILISMDDYQRMCPPKGTFWDHLEAFRGRHGLNAEGVEAAEWPTASREDVSPRDFEW